MRAGSLASSLMLGGRRVQVERPRVRSINSHEITSKLAGMECTGSASAARHGADAGGGLDSELRALARAAADPAGLKRLVLGSGAERVIRDSTVPVLVLRTS